MTTTSPFIIEFPTHQGKGGLLSFGEFDSQIPFPIERIYWSYDMKADTERGNHYHPSSERVVISMKGQISVSIESLDGKITTFQLSNASKGLFIPSNHWIKMQLEKDVIMLAVASSKFEEGESIADYTRFEALKNG
jgi:oxalate decarboxylase/phosphoglucose isomerase-like protein (cupin superfamily)